MFKPQSENPKRKVDNDPKTVPWINESQIQRVDILLLLKSLMKNTNKYILNLLNYVHFGNR